MTVQTNFYEETLIRVLVCVVMHVRQHGYSRRMQSLARSATCRQAARGSTSVRSNGAGWLSNARPVDRAGYNWGGCWDE